METFTLSPTLSHLNGWEKISSNRMRNKKSVSFHKSVFVCDELRYMALFRSRFFFVQTLHSRFLSQCMKRVSGFICTAIISSDFWGEVICWNESRLYDRLFLVCLCTCDLLKPFSSSEKWKYTFSDVVRLALLKGLQWLHCRIRHVTVRLGYAVIIHIIIQFPHTDSCAWT